MLSFLVIISLRLSDENSFFIWSFDIWGGMKSGFEMLEAETEGKVVPLLCEEEDAMETFIPIDHSCWAMICKIWSA